MSSFWKQTKLIKHKKQWTSLHRCLSGNIFFTYVELLVRIFLHYLFCRTVAKFSWEQIWITKFIWPTVCLINFLLRNISRGNLNETSSSFPLKEIGYYMLKNPNDTVSLSSACTWIWNEYGNLRVIFLNLRFHSK